MENSESQSRLQYQIAIQNQQSWADTFANDKNLRAMNERLIVLYERMTPKIIVMPDGGYNFILSNLLPEEEHEIQKNHRDKKTLHKNVLSSRFNKYNIQAMSENKRYRKSDNWMPKLKSVEYQQYILERLTYLIKMEAKFDTNLMNGLSVETFDTQLHSILIQFKKNVYGERLKEEVKIKMSYQIPDGFWQHFKQDYFPQFLLDRFPVKYKLFTETRVLYFKRDFVFPKVYSPNIDQLSHYVIRDLHDDFYDFDELKKDE